MARFDITGLEDFMKDLDRLGKLDDVAPVMLEEAVPLLHDELMKQAKPFSDTGAMVKSIKKTKTIKGIWGGFYICVRPTGKDKKGIRNMEKLAWLEFGVKGRAATPIITKAVLNTEEAVLEKMQEVYNREMKME